MRKSVVFAIFVAVAGSAGAAMAEPCDSPREVVLAVSGDTAVVDGKEVMSRTAYSCGHFWSSANLQEKSLAENGNALERFNLASAYARTGRYDQAETLYRSVVRDGEFLNVRMDTAYASQGARPTGFNLSDEAGRRLTGIAYVRRLLGEKGSPSAPNSPLSALDAGVNAADITTSRAGDPSTGSLAVVQPSATTADAFGLDAAEVTGVAPLSDARVLELDGLTL